MDSHFHDIAHFIILIDYHVNVQEKKQDNRICQNPKFHNMHNVACACNLREDFDYNFTPIWSHAGENEKKKWLNFTNI